MRLDLVREGRRWPEPEYRFKHALIQEAAYRTLVTADRNRLHREAATWLEARYEDREEEVAGLLAHHWLAADDEDKAVTYLTIAGDRARQEYALDEAIGHYRELLPILERRGEDREIALVLFKLALALHMSLRFKEANETYQRAFPFWTPPEPFPDEPTATVRVATSYRPRVNDPRAAIAWPDIQLCMQLFDRLVEQWPERTIVPSLADRWEIADDGLRYVFHLRDGLEWSDGTPLTAGDIEFGIKRVLDPVAPGSSVAIYFVLENGQDYYLGRNEDADRVGVTALDDRTVEFRLVAPAPYFMSVMNRPDGGPQPRHAIEAEGASWTDVGRQVVSGAFRIVEQTDDLLALERQPNDVGSRVGNIRRVEYVRSSVADAVDRLERGDLDIGTVRYTPRLADVVPSVRDRRACRTGRLVGVLRLRPRAPDPVERGLPSRPGACGRSGDPGEPGPGQRGGGDRRRRPARAPGPHAGHRPAVRSGQGSRVPRGERRPRAERDDRGDRDVGDAVPRGRGGHVERGPRAWTCGWSRGPSSER